MTTKPETKPEDALYDEVHAQMTDYRRANGGKTPSRAEVAKALRRRKSDISQAMSQIEQDELTETARLGALPEIPADVTDAGAKLVDRIWVAAHETASLALGEMRSRLSEMQALQRRQLAEVEDLVRQTEDELDVVNGRAAAAEDELLLLRTENVRLTNELSRAEAKLEDREAFVAMLNAASSPKPERAPRKAKGNALEPDGAANTDDRTDTADLPMGRTQ